MGIDGKEVFCNVVSASHSDTNASFINKNTDADELVNNWQPTQPYTAPRVEEPFELYLVFKSQPASLPKTFAYVFAFERRTQSVLVCQRMCC